MNLKYTNKLSDNSATMLLYKPIGRDGIDGAAFADELYWHSKNVPLINVRINTPGGSIFDGYSIYAAMREVGVPVDTYNDFLAGSMGGIIAQQGRKRKAADNALIMLHNPSGGDSKKDKEILGLLKNSLVETFVQRTGKESKIISDLMDVESWVEARMVNGISPMIEMGLVDELYSSSIKISPTAQVFNAQKLYSYSNNILNKDSMENEKLEQLTKQVDNLAKAVESLNKEKEAKDLEITNLKKSLEEKDTILKAQTDKAAVELIENAIKEGKVKADSRDKLIGDAKNSFDVVKSMLDSMPSSTASRFTNVANSGGSAKSDKGEGRESWTIRDFEEKDPAALAEIFKNNKELYQEMYNKEYKN